TDERADPLFEFQLRVYAAAARGEGLTVEAAYLHHLKDSSRKGIGIDAGVTTEARRRAEGLIAGLRQGRFVPNPEPPKCRSCDVRAVCRRAAYRPHES